MDQNNNSYQLIDWMIYDSVSEPDDKLYVKKYTKYELTMDESFTGKDILELPLYESKDRKFLFHLSFNIGDGEKYNQFVMRIDHIESINLHYKTDTINDPMIQQRQREIETLKKERGALCDLIDGALIQDEEICHTIREKYPRFYEINQINQMNDEFDLVNKQIQIHNSEIQRFKEKHVGDDSVSVNIGFLKKVWQPDEVYGPFKLGDGEYYCHLTELDDEEGIRLILEEYESFEYDLI